MRGGEKEKNVILLMQINIYMHVVPFQQNKNISEF